MLGVKNNRSTIKGNYAKVLKNEIDKEKSNNETLTITTTLQFEKPLEYAEVTIEKPEGMSDAQFEVFVKHLQEEIEKENVKEWELTT